MPAPYRRLGRVLKAHGTNGEVSVAATTDLTVLASAETAVWIVPPPASGAVPHVITSVRSGPRGPLVRVSGVDQAADAHELAGRWLLARGEELPAEQEGEAFLGMTVHDRERGEIGIVSDVIVTGANDVLVVTDGPFGEVLVPVIEDVIRGIDEDSHVIDVVLLDGLIDGD